jgi:hypothetical protein
MRKHIVMGIVDWLEFKMVQIHVMFRDGGESQNVSYPVLIIRLEKTPDIEL